jgi:hypothetical protein
MDYLSTDGIRDELRRKDDNRLAKDFRRTFRIPFEVFEDLIDLIISKGWYDTSRKSATGQPCSDLELLLLYQLIMCS